MFLRKKQKAIVIGAGFSGISAAASLASKGYEVHVLEKHTTAGGRARVFNKNGFKFDMGPSWYWMPDVMEQFFKRFNSEDLIPQLKRLDPSYQVIFSKEDTMPVPADYNALKQLFESIEKGSGEKLDAFLAEAEVKYDESMRKFIFKPCLSLSEFFSPDIMKSALKLDLLQPYAKHVRKYFKSEKLLQLLEFPILFLGALPQNIPALYSMMTYADIKLGTWYPMGGFGELVNGMVKTAERLGVTFHYDTNVQSFEINDKSITGIKTSKGDFEADVIVSSADYNFTEQQLLPEQYRKYTPKYWNSRTMAPSCLLYYIGVNKKIEKLLHHNLFFEDSFTEHAHNIYTMPKWPQKPLYYVCCPSKTDPAVAPEGMENLFILIPVAPGLMDSKRIREKYFEDTIKRLEEYCGESIADHIVTYTDYAATDFTNDYNAFKGNAYGLANTLKQTAVLKPSIKSNKVKNLYYTGQLTVPGPGVPPAIISGQVVADYIANKHKIKNHESIV